MRYFVTLGLALGELLTHAACGQALSQWSEHQVDHHVHNAITTSSVKKKKKKKGRLCLMLRELADGIKNMVIMNLQVVVRWEGLHVCWRKTSELKWIVTTFKIIIIKKRIQPSREKKEERSNV